VAVEQPTAETGAARPLRGAPRGLARVTGLLTGRPETGALIAALTVFVVFTVWADNFLTRQSLASTLTLAAELAIVAMAVTLLMIAGEFDLSVGSVLGASSILVPWLMVTHDVPAVLAVPTALAAATSIGFLNGIVVITTRIPSFIVTLGGLLFWRGVVFVITEGFPITVPREAKIFDFFSYRAQDGVLSGFNVSALWFGGLAVVLAFVLTRTTTGNWIFASGGNERAARSMGVPVDRLRVVLFMLTAACAGLAGVIQVGRFSSVDANRGLNLELEAIAAAVIGGSRLSGGYGSVIGTALGCLMIGMIRNGLILAGVASYWYQAIIGLLIVAAVIVNQTAGRTRPQRV
jgi:simple sugar transport system permease protein